MVIKTRKISLFLAIAALCSMVILPLFGADMDTAGIVGETALQRAAFAENADLVAKFLETATDREKLKKRCKRTLALLEQREPTNIIAYNTTKRYLRLDARLLSQRLLKKILRPALEEDKKLTPDERMRATRLIMLGADCNYTAKEGTLLTLAYKLKDKCLQMFMRNYGNANVALAESYLIKRKITPIRRMSEISSASFDGSSEESETHSGSETDSTTSSDDYTCDEISTPRKRAKRGFMNAVLDYTYTLPGIRHTITAYKVAKGITLVASVGSAMYLEKKGYRRTASIVGVPAIAIAYFDDMNI